LNPTQKSLCLRPWDWGCFFFPAFIHYFK
jgi:hypothetical protein